MTCADVRSDFLRERILERRGNMTDLTVCDSIVWLVRTSPVVENFKFLVDHQVDLNKTYTLLVQVCKNVALFKRTRQIRKHRLQRGFSKHESAQI